MKPSERIGPAPEIENRLQSLRKKRGISAAQLARSVGVARQTIYAIEAGGFLPNTVISLQLARVLKAPVHELFELRRQERPVRSRR